MFFSKPVGPLGEPWNKTYHKHMAGRLGRGMTYTAFDCEMTGLNPKKHHLIAIGAVRIRDGRLCLGERFYSLIKAPEANMSRENVLIHRIGHDSVASAASAEQILPEFLDFVGDTVLLAHCSALDMSFLQALAKKSGRAKMINPVLDTAAIYKWLRNREDRHHVLGPEELQLESICQRLNVPQYKAHHAFYDALTCGSVFLKLLVLLEAAGIFTFRDICGASRHRLSNGGI